MIRPPRSASPWGWVLRAPAPTPSCPHDSPLRSEPMLSSLSSMRKLRQRFMVCQGDLSDTV